MASAVFTAPAASRSASPGCRRRPCRRSLQVELDGPFADPERLRDQRVRQTAGDPAQNVGLARGEVPALARRRQRIGNDHHLPGRAHNREESVRLLGAPQRRQIPAALAGRAGDGVGQRRDTPWRSRSSRIWAFVLACRTSPPGRRRTPARRSRSARCRAPRARPPAQPAAPVDRRCGRACLPAP